MLGLGTGFYGVGGKTYPGGGWLPTDESSLEAWYKQGTYIKSGTDSWPDSSGNDHNMLQATSGNKPSFAGGGNPVVFDGSDHLESVTDITLTDSFTVGIKLNTSDPTNVFIGDNDSNNNFYKQLDADTFRFRNTAGIADVDLNGGNSFGDDYLVITRDGSDAFKVWFNGVEQTGTATRGTDSIINAIGVKNPDADDFVGDIYEIQIYNSTSANLTANINARLASL